MGCLSALCADAFAFFFSFLFFSLGVVFLGFLGLGSTLFVVLLWLCCDVALFAAVVVLFALVLFLVYQVAY